MTEREKMIEIVLDTEITGIKLRNITGGISTANAIADALIAAGIRDITREGYICMNGEVIVPTPNIYNKVVELLGCPKISKEGSND